MQVYAMCLTIRIVGLKKTQNYLINVKLYQVEHKLIL